jgi:hypothetical protein
MPVVDLALRAARYLAVGASSTYKGFRRPNLLDPGLVENVVPADDPRELGVFSFHYYWQHV